MPSGWTFDFISFAIGLATATLVFAFLFIQRRRLAALRDWLGERRETLREGLTSGTDERHRADVFRLADNAHLAASLFPLDQILVPPRLLAPPMPLDPAQLPEPDTFSTIPYMPEWPGLAAALNAPTLSLAEALQSRWNLLILGPPGAGKTVCLAMIAAQAASGDPALGGPEVAPFFVHAGDLLLSDDGGGSPDDLLIAAAQHRASAITATRLPALIRARLKAGHALILLDGLDELPRPQVEQVAGWLEKFLEAFPNNRVIAAGPLTGFGPVARLGLVPLPLAQWREDDHRQLLAQWSEAWSNSVRRPEAEIDPTILTGWLSTGNSERTPLDTTLKAWAACAGDVRGNRPIHGIDALLPRRFRHPAGRRALEALAVEQLSREGFGIPNDEAVSLARPLLEGTGWKADAQDLLIDLIDRGLLVRHPGNRLTLLHPSIAGALAASAVAGAEAAEDAEPALPQDDRDIQRWQVALPYYAALADAGPLIARRLKQRDAGLHSNLLAMAGWLRDAPPEAPWRSEILRRMAQLFLDSDETASLRGRVLAAFVASRDPGAVQLFRQSLNSPDPIARRLAALGLGALKDTSAVTLLARALDDDSEGVRQAACLALATIGSEAAIETLIEALLVGDEGLRRAAAEALASHREEGRTILKEALEDDDLLVRRAAVLGVSRLEEDWVPAALEEMQINDSQWLVQNTAAEALERRKNPPDRVPPPDVPPHELGWLIAFAARLGSGVPPGQPALAMLIRASREGSPEERMAATQALGKLGTDSVVGDLYAALGDSLPDVREMAFDALAYLEAALGQRLPPPGQFGLA